MFTYTLTADDAERVNRRRLTDTSGLFKYDDITGDYVPVDPGKMVHVGNPVSEGDILPIIVVKVHADSTVNGQVILDGSDTLWVTSVKVDMPHD